MSKSAMLAAGAMAMALVAVLAVLRLQRTRVETQRTSAAAPSRMSGALELATSAPAGARRAGAPARGEAGSAALTVVVVDDLEQSVPGARVFRAVGEESCVELGVSDPAGVVRSSALEAPFRLVVTGEGWQTRELLVERETALVRVVVRRGARISGTLVCSGSELPPEPGSGARVVAWPSTWRFPPRGVARRLAASDPRTPSATADSVGRFELTGLAHGASYAVVGIGRGWCTWPPVVLAPSSDNVVRMDWIVGVRALVREVGGGPLRLPPLRSYGERVPVKELEALGGRLLLLPNLVGELLGAGPSSDPGDPTRVEFLFACSEELPMLGPIPFEVDLPGYRPDSRELWAMPTDHGLHEHVVEARPTGEARRDVRIDIARSPSAATERLSVRGHLGQLVLLGTGAARVSVDLPDLSAASLLLRDLPFSLIPDALELNGDPPARLRCERRSDDSTGSERWSIDASGYEAVRVELLLPDDSPYDGPALLLAGKSEDELTVLTYFDRGPYVLVAQDVASLQVVALEPAGELDPFELATTGNGVRRRIRIPWQ
jgi:hypothetical protein